MVVVMVVVQVVVVVMVVVQVVDGGSVRWAVGAGCYDTWRVLGCGGVDRGNWKCDVDGGNWHSVAS